MTITFNENMLPNFYNGNIHEPISAYVCEDGNGIYWNLSHMVNGNRVDEFPTSALETYKRIKELDK